MFAAAVATAHLRLHRGPARLHFGVLPLVVALLRACRRAALGSAGLTLPPAMAGVGHQGGRGERGGGECCGDQ